jgi:hypothetical protein
MHETLDARIGLERIPQGLAVPPRLGPYVETDDAIGSGVETHGAL